MTFSAIHIRADIVIDRPTVLLNWYSENVRRGPDYYFRVSPLLDSDAIEFGDLAWAVLLEGRPSSAAAQSLLRRTPIALDAVPKEPLATLNQERRALIVDAIESLLWLDGFASSLATKVLHVRRRASVPVLDNQAIFGTFMRPDWVLGNRPRSGSVRDRLSISRALEAIHGSLTDERSDRGWELLQREAHRDRSLGVTQIELFDICWWALVRADANTLRTAGVAQR
ncbi:MAG: hypothetical protein RL238_2841 [Actinomycetota bacterium]|jgi:hypothetical protein